MSATLSCGADPTFTLPPADTFTWPGHQPELGMDLADHSQSSLPVGIQPFPSAQQTKMFPEKKTVMAAGVLKDCASPL